MLASQRLNVKENENLLGHSRSKVWFYAHSDLNPISLNKS